MNRYTPVGTALFALFASPTAIAQQPPSNQQPAGIATLQTVTVHGVTANDAFTVDQTSLNKLPAALSCCRWLIACKSL
ncbi:hypothetical protein LSG25_02645 [Paralcaligenes sp. KSB-10]|uniref:hypothetical protein n=1 Tax=Paralcaligenes sp. KSB-10 TaxID=2901142 RepID=UPI001E45B544|nr:hypothetical protein [Paralcaligenes sp. KSB-10]UHL64821.1 hypothetical protein LSG25_02645 [Paralcaligenes sp. KSB-10]